MLLAGLAAQAQTAPGTTASPAGTIVLVEGDARIVAAGAAARPAKAGDVIREGDSLITHKDGEVHLSMQDTGFIALRPNTRFAIVSYKADGDAGDKGIFRLLAGGFRSVTGWIGKFNARGYQVHTPTATIGIRGTDHEPRYIPEGSTEGEPGTYDRVFVGQSFIETPAGETAIAPDQAGFVSVRPLDRPRLLAGVPVFFRPSPHENEIAAKHAEIQRVIDQRREERRKVIKEKRSELEAARAQAKALREKNEEAVEAQKSAAQEQAREMQAKREKLKADTTAANEAQKAVQAKRKALQEDVASGRVSRDELQKRRAALREESAAAQRSLENVRAMQKALNDAADANADARSSAIRQRLNATDEQRHNVTEKRHDMATESESTRDEMKGLQKQESKRFREELKADRKANPQPSGNADDSKSR